MDTDRRVRVAVMVTNILDLYLLFLLYLPVISNCNYRGETTNNIIIIQLYTPSNGIFYSKQ